jgi:formylglycine-generating enzyme required for sulfatase activity
MSVVDPTGGGSGVWTHGPWRWVSLNENYRVGRGGQWYLMRRCSDPSSRYRMIPSNRHTEFGFRPVCNAGVR